MMQDFSNSPSARQDKIIISSNTKSEEDVSPKYPSFVLFVMQKKIDIPNVKQT